MSKQIDETVEEPTTRTRKKSGLLIFFFSLIMVLLMGAAGVGYLRLIKMNAAFESQAAGLQQQMQVMEQSIQHLQQMSTDDIRTTILNRWYVTEAQYLVSLAKNYMQFMRNMPAALVLLQQADQSLQNVKDGSVDAMRQQLAEYIAALGSLQPVDETALYSQINTISNQIDKLPLPISPLRQEKTEMPVMDEAGLSWWRKGLNHTMQALSKIVIVRYNDARMPPLIMPEEKNFLLQNLHSEMENAMWAVLHHNATVYQTSLTRATNWIQQYFVQQSPATINVLQALNALKTINIEPQPIDVAAVMHQFDEYLKG